MNEEAFYRIQTWLLHEHDLLVSYWDIESAASDAAWDDPLEPAVVDAVLVEAQPTSCLVTEAGRALVKP